MDMGVGSVFGMFFCTYFECLDIYVHKYSM